MLRRLLTRWATAHELGDLKHQADALQRALAVAQGELTEARATIKLRDLEVAGLAAVISRDRERVAAEAAIASRQIADCENGATSSRHEDRLYAMGVSRNGSH